METRLPKPWSYQLRVAVFGGHDRDAVTDRMSGDLHRTLSGLTPTEIRFRPGADAGASKEEARRQAARAIDEAEVVVFVAAEAQLKAGGLLSRALTYALRADRMVIQLASVGTDPRRIVVDKRSKKNPSDGAEAVPFKTGGLPRRARKLSPGWAQLDAYNRDRVRMWTKGRPCAAYLAQVEKQEGRVVEALPEATSAPLLQHIVPELALANAVAIANRARHIRASVGVFALSALAVGLVVFQSQFSPQSRWVFAVELLLMVAAFALVLFGKRWHERWILARFLTEQLRGAKVACVLGPPTAGSIAAAHLPAMLRVDPPLPFYVGPRGWVGSIANELVARVGAAGASAPFEVAKEFVLRDLLRYQQKWHERNARRKLRPHNLLRGAVYLLFFMTLVAAWLHVIEPGAHAASGESLWDRLGERGYWLTFCAIFFPALGGALHAIDKGLEYERVAARSEGMASVLARYVEHAEEAQSIDALQAITADAMRLIDLENYEWWALLSFAAPELAA